MRARQGARQAMIEAAVVMIAWDAIVVGAGPAGRAVAYDLATDGAKVLLVDQPSFPRPKRCAGGLTIKTLKRLRYFVAPVLHSVVREVCVIVAAGPERRFCAGVRSGLASF